MTPTTLDGMEHIYHTIMYTSVTDVQVLVIVIQLLHQQFLKTQPLVQQVEVLTHTLEHMRVTLISVVLKHMVTAKVLVTYMLDNQMSMVVVLHTMVITLHPHLVLSKVMISHSTEETMVQIVELLSIVIMILHSTSSDRLDQELHKELHHLQLLLLQLLLT